MNFDAFSGGIEPGGLRNKSDIGILICYMLHNINSPFPEDDIIGIIQENSIANYFETSAAIAELVKCGNIKYTDDNKKNLQITNNGILISSQLYDTVSVTVRQKTIGAIMRLAAQKKLDNYEILKRYEMQLAMQIITKEEYDEKVNEILK